jgi:hypothetical protein
MARRTSLKDLLDRETEKPVLGELYTHYGVSTDNLRRCPDVLDAISAAFNGLTSRNLTPQMLLRYMINRRKNDGGDWPKLGDQARKLDPATKLFSDAEIEVLRQVYLAMDIPSDEFLFRPKMAAELADKFAAATGKRAGGSLLIAVVIAKRKRGLWPRIRDAETASFPDISIVAQQHRTGSA